MNLSEAVIERVRLRIEIRKRWLAQRPDSPWEPLSDGAQQNAWEQTEPEVAPLRMRTDALHGSLGETPAWKRLSEAFALTAFEQDTLQLCLACELDPEVRAWLGALSRLSAPWAHEECVRVLFTHPRHAVVTATSPLRMWDLVTWRPEGGGFPERLVLDAVIRDRLLDYELLDPIIAGAVRSVGPVNPLVSWPIEATAMQLLTDLEREERWPVRVTVVGVPGVGRRSFARLVCEHIGLPPLAIEPLDFDQDAWPLFVRRVARQVWLDQRALLWMRRPILPWPSLVRRVPVEVMPAIDGDAELIDHGDHPILQRVVRLAPPDRVERRALWSALFPPAKHWSLDELEGVVDRHRVVPGDLIRVAASGASSPADVREFLHAKGRPALAGLAEHLPRTVGLADLILPEPTLAALRELIDEARIRPSLFDEAAVRRLYPQARGMLALFSGSPGTGKTMAAQVVAAELGLEVFRIDLSAIVSKYIGETSTNLSRVLRRAAALDAVLFFDEADALFGKRTDIRDAHDRYANTDTNHLLQEVESYEGIAILATNRKSNIDPAFFRRIRHHLEFRKPDAAVREALWSRLISELAGTAVTETLRRDVSSLSQRVELTGGQIKSAVLSALVRSRTERVRLDRTHLEHAVQREMEKEERGLSERDRRRLWTEA